MMNVVFPYRNKLNDFVMSSDVKRFLNIVLKITCVQKAVQLSHTDFFLIYQPLLVLYSAAY